MNIEYENVMKLEPDDQLEYFVQEVVDQGMVWVLADDEGDILAIEGDGSRAEIPVWPSREFVEEIRTGELENYEAVNIEVDEFVRNILPEIIKNHEELLLFYDGENAICVDKRSFMENLKFEIEEKRRWYSKLEPIDKTWDWSKKDLDFAKNIEKTRERYRKNKPDGKVMKKPYWMEPKDQMNQIYDNQEELLINGMIVYGCVILANPMLKDKYPRIDSGMMVLFSEDEYFDENPQEYQKISDRIAEYGMGEIDIVPKGIQKILDGVSSEDWVFNMELPENITDGRKVYCTSMMLQRDLVPEGMLIGNILPILTDPDDMKISITVPEKYWTAEMVDYYRQYDEDSELRKNIVNSIDQKAVERTLKMSSEQKYQYFVDEVAKNKELWVLTEDGGFVTEEEDGLHMSVWPTKDLAMASRIGLFSEFEPMAIDVYEFMAKWMPKMIRDEVVLELFRFRNDFLNVDIEILKEELNDALGN